MINNGSSTRPGWFDNPGWEVTYDAAEARRRFFIYEAWHEEEKERLRQEREAANLERLKFQQSQFQCIDSQQCASGFACVGGRCQYIDPTGATGDGGEAGCGAAPGGSGGGGGNGGGCGGSGATGGGGASSSIQSCTTSSAGICPGSFRPDDGDGGGGGGGPCGDTCCRCGTSGCGCIKGKCPDPPNTCSRFCQEVEVIGGSVMKCRAKRCEGFCQKCVDIDETPTCVPDSYAEATDCRCGYLCPECDHCSFSGNCLSRNCPQPPPPPEEPPVDKCEAVCRSKEVCVTNSDTGAVTCNTVEECEDLPPDCEPCDCNCNDECPECMICNTGTGKCQQDPSCNGCQPDTLYWTRSNATTLYYGKYIGTCDLSGQTIRQAGAGSGSISTSCGPLTARMIQSPIQTPTNIVPAKTYGVGGQTCTNGVFKGDVIQEQPGIWEVTDANGNVVDTVTFGYATITGSVYNSSATPNIVTFNR